MPAREDQAAMGQMARGMVEKLEGFANSLGEGQYLPSQKFLRWAMRGMTAAKSVVLAEIGRKLMPGFRSLKQVEKKLSYHVNNPRWDAEKSHERYLNRVKGWVRSDTYVALDMGEITKSRARSMPYLDWVRDGSRKGSEEEKRAVGWWKVEIEAMLRRQGEVFHLPLEDRIFSTKEPGFLSQNKVVFATVDRVLAHIGRHGIWLADRGFDGEQCLRFLTDRKLRFVVRSQGERHARAPGRRCRRIKRVAADVPLTPATCVLRRGESHALRVGYCSITLPILPGVRLFLVVAEGLGLKPLLLMTNVEVASLDKAVELVETYLRRWGVEEACRFVKQSYDLENIRSLCWLGIRRLAYMATWCFGFLCLVSLTTGKKVLRGLLALYPSFGPTPPFYYYRLVEGVAALLCPGPWAGFRLSG